VACLLLGLVISWIVAAIGAVIAVVFAVLWARDVTRDVRADVPHMEPETRAVADEPTAVAATPAAADELPPAYTRSRFLEASTIGLGAAIGAVVTLPVLGFTVLPPFTDVEESEADLGPLENFPQGTYVIASFLANPKAGEVSRRTTFVRNNGPTDAGEPSFTILYSRCVHLGCPVQPNGPIDEEARSGARATAASTTQRATAAPARRFARWIATRTRSRTGTSCSASSTRWATSRAPGPARRSPATRGRFRARTSTESRRGCTRSSRVR
jgi:Rieske Fe-S protein